MALDPRTPVIIGAGQAVQRATGLDDAVEPIVLIARAVRAATEDAGLDAVPPAQSIRVVNLLSWRYRDAARLLADDLGLSPDETAYTTASGNTPQLLVNATAEEIQRGELDLAILAGGECWRTRMRARRTDAHLDWRKLPDGTQPSRMFGSDESMSGPVESGIGLVMPVQFYPMFESARRGAAGEGVDQHQARIAELWARFSAVAASNPYAWVKRALSAEEIATPGPDNRMIGLPYPKYMNSNNDVDQAAALILCSAARARALGVPEERWVFPHAGVDVHDHYHVSNRDDLGKTPAVKVAGRVLFELAGVGVDDLELVDLYSCFPSAVEAGAEALGLSLERPLTRTGGLSFAGGPWNNYVMHALATVVRELREQPEAKALVWGNGGYLTKHSLGVLAARPPAGGFRRESPQAEIDALPRRDVATGQDAEGAVTIEGYTVMHDRDGKPETAFAACVLPDGHRAWGTSHEPDLVAAMCEGEWVGRQARLGADASLRV